MALHCFEMGLLSPRNVVVVAVVVVMGSRYSGPVGALRAPTFDISLLTFGNQRAVVG